MTNPHAESQGTEDDAWTMIEEHGITFSRTDPDGRYYELGDEAPVKGLTVDKSTGDIRFKWRSNSSDRARTEQDKDAAKFELCNGDGVSITEYDSSSGDEPTVKQEWWFSWPEIFMKLTGLSYRPSIHSGL